jgi:hypothetical protein
VSIGIRVNNLWGRKKKAKITDKLRAQVMRNNLHAKNIFCHMDYGKHINSFSFSWRQTNPEASMAGGAAAITVVKEMAQIGLTGSRSVLHSTVLQHFISIINLLPDL